MNKAIDLGIGDYRLVVTDNVGLDAGCISTQDFTVNSARHDIVITASSTDQITCTPDGTAQLETITEDAVAEVLPFAGWNVYFLDTLQADITPGGITGLPGDPYSNLSAGTYYVQTQNDFTKCYSSPYQVTVNDVSTDPIISVLQEMPDFACVGGANTGILAPTITGGTDGDAAMGNYTISWTSIATGLVPTTDALNKAIDLGIGDYRLVVTDNVGLDAGCISTQDFTVNSARHDIVITASSTDQTICLPDGTVQLNSIDEDSNPMGLSTVEWTVSLLDNNQTDITQVGPTGFAGDPYTGLGVGNYFVRVQDDSTLCYSDVYPVEIKDVSVDPIIDIAISVPQYSLNPNPLSWTGEMKASVVEPGTGLPDPAGYVYSWHAGLDTTTPTLSTLDSASYLGTGDHTLVARGIGTGCESSYSAYLPYVYLEPTFNTYKRAKTVCVPADGSIEVTDIDLDGNPDLLSDYTFNWHHDVYSSGDVPDAIIAGNDTRTAYDNIDGGSYYIIAREDWWMLDSYPIKVEVIDSTTNPMIQVDGAIYSNLKSCYQSIYADGSIGVEIYEDASNPYVNFPYINAPFSYAYTWYNGNVADPANVIVDSTNRAISRLAVGDYTLVVDNLDNNCRSERTFTIEDESITPIITPSHVSNTSCVAEMANGDAIADINNSDDLFTFSWYEGTDVSGTPVHYGSVWPGRQQGVYTVVAVDQRTGTCFSEPTSIQVNDVLEYPTILINELYPVTNCDPERPNGVLSAVTQVGIEGHTFEWYLAGELYDEGPIATKFGLLKYQLVATNDFTQCATTMEAYATPLFSAVPMPDVFIINEMTSCSEPDGVVTASISDNVTNYIFRYYDQSGSGQLNNYFEDFKMYDLEEATYYVTAEDRSTGCVSDSTEFSISNETYYPDIDIISTPSSCLEPTGSANVVISDETREYKVTWYGDNGFEAQLKELVYIPSGNYRVEVEGTEGCFSSDEVEVMKDVLIYNGVSPNGDGLNDYFKIICLEQFPGNNVKIYNRAGLLVYDQTFYDGNDPSSRFEGISNEGLSVIGSELPIGTYFYVIDKNDGSTAKVGYLELNR